MAYHDVTPLFTVLSYAPWYDLKQLLSMVHQLRKINFAIVEQRQQALERINSLVTICPFGDTQQFDADHLYVCEMLGDWPRKFQQLKSALSFKERDLRTIVPRQEQSNSNVEVGSVSDAQQAFWNATTSILDELIRLDHVYSRESFEEYLNLDWH